MQRQKKFRLERGALAALVLLLHVTIALVFMQMRVSTPDAYGTAEPLVAMLLDDPRGVPPGAAPMSADPPAITPKISWAPPVVEIAFEEEPDVPLADRDAPQPEPQSTSSANTATSGSGTAANGPRGGGSGLTIIERVLPRYPERSVRLGEEGTVVVHVQVNEKGRVSDVRLARGSGHERLDGAAVAAVRRWKFIPASQGSTPVSSWGETELRFVLYPFVFSRVAEQPADRGSEEQVKAGVSEVAAAGGEAGLRRFIQDFSGAGFVRTSGRDAGTESTKFRAALEEWGTVHTVEFKSAFGDHRWSRYDIKPQYRTAGTGDSVELKWDIYEVRHERGTSLWRIALDRNGTVWAAQARDATARP